MWQKVKFPGSARSEPRAGGAVTSGAGLSSFIPFPTKAAQGAPRTGPSPLEQMAGAGGGSQRGPVLNQ